MAETKTKKPVRHVVLYIKRQGAKSEPQPLCSHEKGDPTMNDVHAALRVRHTQHALDGGGQVPIFDAVEEEAGEAVA